VSLFTLRVEGLCSASSTLPAETERGRIAAAPLGSTDLPTGRPTGRSLHPPLDLQRALSQERGARAAK
jgi:hypothetical protein